MKACRNLHHSLCLSEVVQDGVENILDLRVFYLGPVREGWNPFARYVDYFLSS